MAGTDIENDQDGTAGKKGGGMLVTIAVLLVLSLVGAGGGWVVGGMLAPGIKDAELKAEAAAAPVAEANGKSAEKGEEDAPKERPNLLQLAPITTNLSFPSDNWIRLEVALVFRDLPEEALADRINEDILAYLRTVSLQQIEGPRGFQYLHDDLVERARLRSEGKVTDVIFRTFVIE